MLTSSLRASLMFVRYSFQIATELKASFSIATDRTESTQTHLYNLSCESSPTWQTTASFRIFQEWL